MKSRDQHVELFLDHSDRGWRPPPSGYELADRQALLASRVRPDAGSAGADPGDLGGDRVLRRPHPARGPLRPQGGESGAAHGSKGRRPKLRARALDLLTKINDPPLMAKLREAATRDGAPVAESEYGLLSRLRKARNDAVHGRSPELPPREDVDHAVSIVARLLCTAWRVGDSNAATYDPVPSRNISRKHNPDTSTRPAAITADHRPRPQTSSIAGSPCPPMISRDLPCHAQDSMKEDLKQHADTFEWATANQA